MNEKMREAVENIGGVAGLRAVLKSIGLPLKYSDVSNFMRQGIPLKYTVWVNELKVKHGVDLTAFLTNRKLGRTENFKKLNIYPNLTKVLQGTGLGQVASEINRPNNKNELMGKPPKRFNHNSLIGILSKKLTPEMRQYFIDRYDVENEIAADERSMNDGGLLD